jgi:hypothetical protein
VVHLTGVCMRAEPGASSVRWAEGMSWLRSPSNSCSRVMRCIRIRSCRPVQPRKYTSLERGRWALSSRLMQVEACATAITAKSPGGARHESSECFCIRPSHVTVELCTCARAMD